VKRIGIALAVGVVLVGISGIVAAVAGTARFYQACAVVGLVCVGAAVVMSGILINARSTSGAAMTQLPAPAPGNESDDVVDSETRSRLNSVYPLLAGLPCIVIAAVHYL
jgi:hypothetical protein